MLASEPWPSIVWTWLFHYLKVIGCEASGLVSDEDLVTAVRSETSARDYDGVILAAGKLGGSGLARAGDRNPVHQLRRRWASAPVSRTLSRARNEEARTAGPAGPPPAVEAGTGRPSAAEPG